jgi:hypothetical protein
MNGQNHLIINPKSGRYSQDILDQITTAFKDVLHIYRTHNAGDAEVYASSLGDSARRVIIAGGDGTIHEVINGLRFLNEILISIIPIGTDDLLPWLKPGVSYPSKLTKLFNSGEFGSDFLDALIGINSKQSFRVNSLTTNSGQRISSLKSLIPGCQYPCPNRYQP